MSRLPITSARRAPRSCSRARPGARWIVWILGALLAWPALLNAAGDPTGWPQRPIRLVVPFGPGSSPDLFARLLAVPLSVRLGQAVFVENRPGAAGNVGSAHVARAQPDGYTVLVGTNGPLLLAAMMGTAQGYDPVHDLVPVVLGGYQVNVCAARADSGWSTMADLVASLRATSGGFNFASIGTGSISQLAVAQLAESVGASVVHVPYPSSPAAVTAIIQGDVRFACVPASAVMPMVQAGILRALAVTSARRSDQLPDIPTLIEQGLARTASLSWMALAVPRTTPGPIVAALARAVDSSLPEMRSTMRRHFMETLGGDPVSAARFLADETRLWAPIIAAQGPASAPAGR